MLYLRLEEPSDKHRGTGLRCKRRRNDCTVVALAVALDIDYERALRTLKSYGFNRTGMVDSDMLAALEELNATYQYARLPSKAIGKVFASLPPKGRFLVFIPRHVFAVVDGVIYDSFPSWTRRGRKVAQFVVQVHPNTAKKEKADDNPLIARGPRPRPQA